MNPIIQVADWVLFLAVVFVCVLIVLRSIHWKRPHRLGGLLWFSDRRSYWGPCCEHCLIQYTLRPVFQSAPGNQFHELVCPLCGGVLEGRAFTLQALAEIERQLGVALKVPRAEVPLGANLSPPHAHTSSVQ